MLAYDQPINQPRPVDRQSPPSAGFSVLELIRLLWRRTGRDCCGRANLRQRRRHGRQEPDTEVYGHRPALCRSPRAAARRSRTHAARAGRIRPRHGGREPGTPDHLEQRAAAGDPGEPISTRIRSSAATSKGLLAALLGLFGIEARSATEAKLSQTAALEALNRHITIRKTDRSFIVDIEVWSNDPAKAAMLANALSNAYLAESQTSQATAARRATSDLSGRLKELQERLRNAENALATYKAQNNFVGTQDALISDQQLSAEQPAAGRERAR